MSGSTASLTLADLATSRHRRHAFPTTYSRCLSRFGRQAGSQSRCRSPQKEHGGYSSRRTSRLSQTVTSGSLTWRPTSALRPAGRMDGSSPPNSKGGRSSASIVRDHIRKASGGTTLDAETGADRCPSLSDSFMNSPRSRGMAPGIDPVDPVPSQTPPLTTPRTPQLLNARKVTCVTFGGIGDPHDQPPTPRPTAAERL